MTTKKITTNQNSNYSSLIARCNNIRSLFKKVETGNNYYEFADLFFNISGTDTTGSVPAGTNFDNNKKYISYLLYDAIKGEIDSIEYDGTIDYLKASSNNTNPLYFIKSDPAKSSDKPIKIASKPPTENVYNTHEAQFFVNNVNAVNVGQAVTTSTEKFRYYQDDNKIKYIFCTLRLIETFLDILSAYKNYIDDPANDGKIINNIIITTNETKL